MNAHRWPVAALVLLVGCAHPAPVARRAVVPDAPLASTEASFLDRAATAIRAEDLAWLVALVDVREDLHVSRSCSGGSSSSTQTLDGDGLRDAVQRAGGLHRFLWLNRTDAGPIPITIAPHPRERDVWLLVAGDPPRGATLRFARIDGGWRWESAFVHAP